MNKQEVFDKIFAYALTMTKPAQGNGKCKYRSPNGPCLIGHLIPDELYNVELDDIPTMATSQRMKSILIQAGCQVDVVESDLLISIQQVHDGLFIEDRHDLNRNGGPERSIERAKTFNSRLVAGLVEIAKREQLTVSRPL